MKLSPSMITGFHVPHHALSLPVTHACVKSQLEELIEQGHDPNALGFFFEGSGQFPDRLM